MKIYNTNQEIGCRILLMLGTIKNEYSLERIIYYDYFSLHLNDLEKEYVGLHPSNPNHSSEIIIKRNTIQNAILYLFRKGLLEVTYNLSGFKYKNTELGNHVIEMLDNDYSFKYRECVKKVDKYFGNMKDDDIMNYVTSNIEKWTGQFESEGK